MAYTKYSLTPANNTAAPPDGAPEGMLPSAVNDTMRDMMAQIRDCGDGIRDGTYTMTAPKITGGTITGSTINNSAIGGTTAAAGAFTTLSATGVTTVQAGTVSAPAITTSGDTNTGIFFPAADTIAFTEGGTESMRIDSSGNVGIGTTGGTYKLDVVGAGAQSIRVASSNGDLAILRMLSSGNNEWSIASDTVMRFRKDATEYMRIDSSGNLGIGTSSPSNIVEVSRNQNAETQVRLYNANAGSSARTVLLLGNNSSAGAAGIFLNSSTYSGGGGANALTLYMGLGAPITFETNATERMRILASGDLALGQTTYSTPPTQGNDFLAGGLIINPTRRTSGSAANCYWDASTGVFYRSTSSLRYKTDVQDAAYGLSDVLKLRPVTYKGKSEADGDKVFGGFIAEEIDVAGLKEFVEYDAEGKPDSLAYGNMVSLLAKAIQELNAKVEAQATEIALLKSK